MKRTRTTLRHLRRKLHESLAGVQDIDPPHCVAPLVMKGAAWDPRARRSVLRDCHFAIGRTARRAWPRSGKVAPGKESARTLHAHKTIRAEISYWTASAYWRKRDYRATLMYAKEAEESHADVITVRAASLRGYVGAAKQRYAEALALFHSARDAYNGCRERDRNLLERIVVQIASLEVTLRSARSLGSHVMPQELTRIPEVPGMPRVPGVFRMQIAALDAWLYAFDDEKANAYRRVRIAEDLAPSAAWRVWALANRANISLAFGDVEAAGMFAEHGREIADSLQWNSTADEERVALLFLAEALAVTNPPEAVDMLSCYDALTTPIDRGLLFNSDVRCGS